ncbi:hypothetical protein J2X43_003505 [Rhizobium sp. BE258]|nr:hypothetical protein [Rhizobium sp. BE258]
MVSTKARFHSDDAGRNLLTKSISVCRRIVRRPVTAPLSSTPTTLQLFLPISIPKIEIVMDRLVFLQWQIIILDVLVAGHPIINSAFIRRSWPG